MSFLFKIEGKKVFPNEETLLISPFRDIWERDTTKGKEEAMQELAYIEFMSSMMKSNPYREYPEERKHQVIKDDIIIDSSWKPDELVLKAIEKIKVLQEDGSITYNYWMSNKKAAEKMIDFFNTFDMSEVNIKTGTPIYKPRDITSALSDAEKVLLTLNNLKTKVDEEIFQVVKNKSGKEISPFAKISSIK